MQRDSLRNYLDNLLETSRFRDYCPNGLQVEGRGEVRRLVCGVTASQALINEAIARRADGILVHHGWFWKSDDLRVTGYRRARLAAVLAHDLNLFAYHLPLDAHPELGNNAQLARRLGWSAQGRFGDQDLGMIGTLAEPMPAEQVGDQLAAATGRVPLVLAGSGAPVRRIAWCTGGAQGMFEQAIGAGADLYVTGEASEPCTHLARESGVAFIAAGHHATERYGVQALGSHLAAQCGVTCEFIEVDNPV